jgi:hypothetical protein
LCLRIESSPPESPFIAYSQQQHQTSVREVGVSAAEEKDQQVNDADTSRKEKVTSVYIPPNATQGVQKGILTESGAKIFDALWSQYWGTLMVVMTTVYPIFLLGLAGCYYLGYVKSFVAVLGCMGLVYVAIFCIIISTFLISALPAILLLQST